MTVLPAIAGAGLLAFLGFAVVHGARGKSAWPWLAPALLSAGFFAYSLIPIIQDSPLGFVPKHLQDWWGVQIWLDLLCAFGIGWLFFVPRARAAGMSLWPWLAAIAALGSIGFLAAVARLLWLEQRDRA